MATYDGKLATVVDEPTLRDARATLTDIAPGTGLEGSFYAGLETRPQLVNPQRPGQRAVRHTIFDTENEACGIRRVESKRAASRLCGAYA